MKNNSFLKKQWVPVSETRYEQLDIFVLVKLSLTGDSIDAFYLYNGKQHSAFMSNGKWVYLGSVSPKFCYLRERE